MPRFLWIVLLALYLAVLPAAADTKHITIEDVRTMAFDKGILALKEIGLDHGIWKVQRRDASGRKIEMRVDAASGEIVKMRRNN
jgi:uncharacterized membrane protein